MIQVRLQDPERPWSHAVIYQDIETPVPIQGTVRLLETQENGVKDQLPHGCNLT